MKRSHPRLWQRWFNQVWPVHAAAVRQWDANLRALPSHQRGIRCLRNLRRLTGPFRFDLRRPSLDGQVRRLRECLDTFPGPHPPLLPADVAALRDDHWMSAWGACIRAAKAILKNPRELSAKQFATVVGEVDREFWGGSASRTLHRMRWTVRYEMSRQAATLDVDINADRRWCRFYIPLRLFVATDYPAKVDYFTVPDWESHVVHTATTVLLMAIRCALHPETDSTILDRSWTALNHWIYGNGTVYEDIA